MSLGDRFGVHRVIDPPGALPKAAQRLDNQTPPFDNEIGIHVQALHITSTSFTRLWQESGADQERFATSLSEIVSRYGKFQDPLTGSGGVLMGSVDFVGPALKIELRPGDPVVTMVSLSLTPLRLKSVGTVNPEMGQVEVEGYAILFETGLWSKLPADLPPELALMALDVAGAPAYAARYVQPGQRVLVVGGGKAGLLCMHEAKKQAGAGGQVVLVEKDEGRGKAAVSLGLADQLVLADATQGLTVMRLVEEAFDGSLADVSFNFASLPGTEMGTILSTRDEGKIIFYSMSTDFCRAALGAEGAHKPVEMIIGNGYLPGHTQIALQALRENQVLREYFTALVSQAKNSMPAPEKGGL